MTLFKAIEEPQVEELEIEKFDPKEPSKAVLASDGSDGIVVWYVGHHLDVEIHENGLKCLSDLGLDEAPEGISIWEGKYQWASGSYEYPTEGEMYPKGEFRAPTDEEWVAIRAGTNPFRKPEPAPVAEAGAP